ncbi:hypothetical protein [Paraburkholderia tropica]|uniref:hypothetical protein n=1 Tax=Paraburkholderia tropica TaxID=92647 RepID=UPI0015922A2E|nr:hypothetical protein [Paraburkholderia tropica]
MNSQELDLLKQAVDAASKLMTENQRLRDEIHRLRLVIALKDMPQPRKQPGRPRGSRKIDPDEMTRIAGWVDEEVAEARSRGEKSDRQRVVTEVFEGILQKQGKRKGLAKEKAISMCKRLSRYSPKKSQKLDSL